MQKKTRSIFEELDGIYTERYAKKQERGYIVESRASNVIASAIRLMEQIDSLYDKEQSEDLIFFVEECISAIIFPMS